MLQSFNLDSILNFSDHDSGIDTFSTYCLIKPVLFIHGGKKNTPRREICIAEGNRRLFKLCKEIALWVKQIIPLFRLLSTVQSKLNPARKNYPRTLAPSF